MVRSFGSLGVLMMSNLALWVFGCGGTNQQIESGESGGASSASGGSSGTGGAEGVPDGTGGGGDVSSGGSGGDPEGSGGANGSGGSLGACAGIVPSCTPGEAVCHPSLGRETTCDECGVARENPTGQECVRLLATDKESGGACVVKGERAYHCFPIAGPHGDSSQFQRGELPPGVVQLIVPGDATFWVSASLGALTEDGRALFLSDTGGSGEFVELWTGHCRDMHIADDGTPCSLCDQGLLCADGVSAPSGEILAIDMSDQQIAWLTAEGVYKAALGATVGRLVLPGSFSDLIADQDAAVCALSTDGALHCQDPTEQDVVVLEGPFRGATMGDWPHLCGKSPEGQWACLDIVSKQVTPVPDRDWVVISASRSADCGLTRQGHLLCWDWAGDPVEVPSEYAE